MIKLKPVKYYKEYEHSSVSFYEKGEAKNYEPFDF